MNLLPNFVMVALLGQISFEELHDVACNLWNKTYVFEVVGGMKAFDETSVCCISCASVSFVFYFLQSMLVLEEPAEFPNFPLLASLYRKQQGHLQYFTTQHIMNVSFFFGGGDGLMSEIY